MSKIVHGGKRKGAGRSKISSSKRKKPVTTWLTPTEISHLAGMGSDAQDGIRLLVRRSLKIGKSQPMKKSRSDGSPSMTEILYLPIDSEKLMVRRMSRAST